jgi:hypothetical protein
MRRPPRSASTAPSAPRSLAPRASRLAPRASRLAPRASRLAPRASRHRASKRLFYCQRSQARSSKAAKRPARQRGPAYQAAKRPANSAQCANSSPVRPACLARPPPPARPPARLWSRTEDQATQATNHARPQAAGPSPPPQAEGVYATVPGGATWPFSPAARLPWGHAGNVVGAPVGVSRHSGALAGGRCQRGPHGPAGRHRGQGSAPARPLALDQRGAATSGPGCVGRGRAELCWSRVGHVGA